MCIPHAKAMQRPRTHLKFSLVLSDGYKAQMAHVKALNKEYQNTSHWLAIFWPMRFTMKLSQSEF